MADSMHSIIDSVSSIQSSLLRSDELVFDTNLNGPPWIVHYILDCHFQKELPLRIMFSFNAGMMLFLPVICVHYLTRVD